MHIETIIHHVCCSSSKYWMQKDLFIKWFKFQCATEPVLTSLVLTLSKILLRGPPT